MKIQCPSCQLTGNVNDANIPVTGVYMNCPRCQARFLVERQAGDAASAGTLLNQCPRCQYATFSEEMFAVCPKCGLDAAEYSRTGSEQRLREEKARQAEKIRQQEERARQKYGLDGLEEDAAEPGAVKTGDTPLPVQVIGWLVVAIALVLVGYGIKGEYALSGLLQKADALRKAGDEAASTASLVWQFGMFPVLAIIYGVAMMVIGSQFLRLKEVAIQWLEWGAWVGIVLAGLYEANELLAWFLRSSSSASFLYYLTGIGTTLLMAGILVLPMYLLINYLKSVEFDRISGFFS
ncbi:MAG TPA: zinc-ribbon domain-containing protein [Geobacteraceae bacterium]